MASSKRHAAESSERIVRPPYGDELWMSAGIVVLVLPAVTVIPGSPVPEISILDPAEIMARINTR